MLQHLFTSQVNGDLVMLQSEEGKALQKVAENEARSFFFSFTKYISDQKIFSGQLFALKDSSALWKTNWRNPLRGEMAVKPLWITQQKKSEKCLNNQMFDVLDDCSNGDDTK